MNSPRMKIEKEGEEARFERLSKARQMINNDGWVLSTEQSPRGIERWKKRFGGDKE